ncbi:MAG: mannose-1-phosphate guanylyltransferase [Planctomycetes bacterium]|nr:mannose-1-phosphate guanylyltransferase [Planctomycetota bacterium]
MRHVVIMAGGSGTRFWPESRRQLPKQFLKFAGDQTLIQQAASRCCPAISAEQTWIVTNANHAAETTRQLPQVPKHQILLEPCGRNTAPCIGLAAIQLLAIDPEAVMLVTPADHVINPTAMFQQAVNQAMELVAREPGALVLFGVEPTYPATGFGYIHRGEQLADTSWPTFQVKSFQEKPNQLTAARYSASGEYYWNCGIFVWRAQTILDALSKYAPEIFERLQRLRAAIGTPGWSQALETEFPAMPSISIDYAVLEHAASVYVLEAPFDWDDVGSWHAMARLNPADRDGNTLDGMVCPVESSGCIVRTSADHLVAMIGVKDLIIVHTPTATLVADKRDEGSIKQLIAELERRNLQSYL